MKKLSVLMIIVLLGVMLVGVYSFAASPAVKIIIDNQELQIPSGEPAAYIDKDNRTVIPIKFIAEALGIEVEWDGTQQLVTFTDADITVKLKIGERQATVNGSTVYFDTQAVITQARTFVPLKFVSETFGAKVEWIASTRTVVITTGEIESDIVPVNQVISNVNELNRTDGINITKAKVLSNNPYRMEISEGQTTRAIRVKGEGLGLMVLIQDGKISLEPQ
ncbi:MAG: stalk domain-containing protein, partial [Thermotaleaceae bacterium]